ncbi:hypothetical protein LCGC14_2934100 [marine sediment metagenome]|uniref:Uncharacterized protein n=1 Tax=marine sediment metagenome TaxID=412755 RepID=A0A0F8Y739_9ZZZZ
MGVEIKNKRDMKIIGEKTLKGKVIQTPAQFIEDLSDRINGITVRILEDEKMQLNMTLGFLKAFRRRLNRVGRDRKEN